MIYVIDSKNNIESIYSRPLECEHCNYFYKDCENTECEYYNKKDIIIHHGNLGDILIKFENVYFDKIATLYDSFIQNIKNDKITDETLTFVKQWLSNNSSTINIKKIDDLYFTFLDEFLFTYSAKDSLYNTFDEYEVDSYNKERVKHHIQEYKLLYAIIEKLADKNFYKKGFIRLLYKICYDLVDFGIFVPYTEIEKQILDSDYYDLQQLNIKDVDIYTNSQENLFDFAQNEYQIMQELVLNDNQCNIKKYNIGYSLFDACLISLDYILESGYQIKKCKNCNGFFASLNRSDTLYCDRLSPQDNTKNCKEYGAYRQYQENLKNNECAKLYRNIYMQKQMLSKRNSDIIEYKKDFEKFKVNSQQWKTDVKKGIKAEEEFLSWLKDVKEKKV